jgi:hypothetical protein
VDHPTDLEGGLHVELLEVIEGGFIDVLLVHGTLDYTRTVAYLEEYEAPTASAIIKPTTYVDLLLVMLPAKYLGYVYETGHIDRRGDCEPNIIVFARLIEKLQVSEALRTYEERA